MSNRAERRRQERQGIKVEKEKVYTLTQSRLKQIQIDIYKDAYREAYKEIYHKAYKDAVDTSFGLMLSIPTEILSEDEWKKTADKRIPKFLDKCVNLYEKLATDSIRYTDVLEKVEQRIGQKTYIVERLRAIRTKILEDESKNVA
jgi:predicted nucleic acid-binding protein